MGHKHGNIPRAIMALEHSAATINLAKTTVVSTDQFVHYVNFEVNV